MAEDKTTSIRFSDRERWYLKALVDAGYGDDTTQVIKRFLWDGIRKARSKKEVPSPPAKGWADVPPSSDPADN